MEDIVILSTIGTSCTVYSISNNFYRQSIFYDMLKLEWGSVIYIALLSIYPLSLHWTIYIRLNLVSCLLAPVYLKFCSSVSKFMKGIPVITCAVSFEIVLYALHILISVCLCTLKRHLRNLPIDIVPCQLGAAYRIWECTTLIKSFLFELFGSYRGRTEQLQSFQLFSLPPIHWVVPMEFFLYPSLTCNCYIFRKVFLKTRCFVVNYG